MITLLIPLAIIGLICLVGMRHFIKRHGFGTLFFRFLFGHHMDGQRRTNATFFKRGDKIMHPTGRASKYAHRCHMERTLIRHASWMTTGIIAYGIFVAEMITIVSFMSFMLAIVGLNGKRLERKYQARWVTRGLINPLAQAIAIQWQTTPQIAQQSITIDRDYANAKGMDKIGQIVLPDWYQASSMQKMAFEDLINSRLGVELTIRWHTNKHPMYIEIFRAPIAPTLVPFATMRAAMDALPADKVLLGVTGKGEHKVWDMAGEDPMLCVQANTRRGKTRLLLLILCQLLHQGAEMVIGIDPKRVGLADTLAGVPGAIVYDDPREMEKIFKAVHDFRILMEERYDQLKADRTIQFKRAILAIDEVSFLSQFIKQWWEHNKPKGKGAPKKPAFWDDLAMVLFMGAQVKCNVIIFGQRLESSTMAGLLESFGTRLMAGYTRNAYNRLIGVGAMPVSQKPRGRFLYFDGGDNPVWIQTILGDDDELHEWAMNGRREWQTAKQENVKVFDIELNKGEINASS